MKTRPNQSGLTSEARSAIATQDQFQAFLESAPDAVVIVDSNGKIAIVNRQTENLFGYSREEMIGQPVEMLVPSRHRPGHVSQRTDYTGHPHLRPMGAGLELHGLRKDGTEFPVEISLSPVENPGGMQVISTIRDVSRSKQAAEELRKAKNELEAHVHERTAELAEAVRDLRTELEQHHLTADLLARERDRAKSYLDIAEVAVVALDRTGRVEMINRKGLRILGYEERELLGRNWFTACVPKQIRAASSARFQQILDGQNVIHHESLVVTKGGEERLIAWHNSLLRDPGGNTIGTLSSGEDITEARRAEENLKRLATIVESSEDAIIGKTLDGTITSWNAAAEKLYGYSAKEAIGQPVTLLAPPEEAGAIADMLLQLKKGHHIRGMETIRVAKDGRRLNVSLTLSPIRDADGKPVAASTIARDITERLRLEQQLRQAQKMEAIGRLAGGIAHDFNNLLGVILGDSELLLSAPEIAGAQRKEVEEIKEAGERAAALTRQLLAFGRQQKLQSQAVNLFAVLSGFESMLRRLLGAEIALDLVLAPDLAPVRADPSQLLQVILNLVVNARDAMPRGGNLRIEAANVTLDEAYPATNPGSQTGPHVQITVTDSGPGMDRQTLARIFEPFFTTKQLGQGAGMGLATAHGIVKQLGGSIWAYSEPGRGATFKILLPQAAESGAPAALAHAEERLPGGTETILLVEDAGLLRRITAEFLQRVGYTVLMAEDGAEALRVFDEHKGKIHLLLTDLAMPGMNGQELADRLVKADPGLKVLYTSGYADSVIADRNIPGFTYAFIEKPFTWRSLAHKVRNTIDRE